MKKTKVAIYNCYIAENDFVAEQNKKNLAKIQEGIEVNQLYEFVGIFEDKCSGIAPMEDRPELLRLLEMAEKGEVNIIGIPMIKRLTRDVTLLIDIVQKFDKHNVKIEFIAEKINTEFFNEQPRLLLLKSHQLFEDIEPEMKM